MIEKLNNWLDKYVLPWPVRFLNTILSFWQLWRC